MRAFMIDSPFDSDSYVIAFDHGTEIVAPMTPSDSRNGEQYYALKALTEATGRNSLFIDWSNFWTLTTRS